MNLTKNSVLKLEWFVNNKPDSFNTFIKYAIVKLDARFCYIYFIYQLPDQSFRIDFVEFYGSELLPQPINNYQDLQEAENGISKHYLQNIVAKYNKEHDNK